MARFAGADVTFWRSLLFQLLDNNGDGQVCERDLFAVMEPIRDTALESLLQADIQIAMAELNSRRVRQGKDRDGEYRTKAVK